jgi:hypothetical protein
MDAALLRCLVCRISAAGAACRTALRVLVVLVAIVSAGCGTFHLARSVVPPSKPPDVAIFVADGAGNFQACSKAVREAAARDKPPPFIHTFEWSHGYGRILADQLHHTYAQSAGRALAREIEEFHAASPRTRIYLLGHSAGSSAVLSALENISPNVVERAFLVAPSVSCRYDLTLALSNVKHTIHVYHSRHDWWYLGVATHLVGTQDRKWLEPAAGRVGFRYSPPSAEQESLAAKLKQHPWKASDANTGHLGGHFGAYNPEFLRRNVLPLTIRGADDHFLDAEDQFADE